MTDDREVFKVRRDAGLKARHEQRLENATYTAAEVKVLTEAALRLGRKEAGEEIAAKFETQASLPSMRGTPTGEMLLVCAAVARDLACYPPQEATTARTEAPGHSDLPQDYRAVRSPQGGDAVDLVGRLREAVEAARVRRLAERKGDRA